MAIEIIPPDARLIYGHDYWRSYTAINEMEVYCDLLDIVEQRIASLENRGGQEAVTLINVKAVISSYALEVGMKSLWALDNPTQDVPHTHDLIEIYDGLKPDTVELLKRLGFTRSELQMFPKPFVTNRYSMESISRDIVTYQPSFIRELAKLLRKILADEDRNARAWQDFVSRSGVGAASVDRGQNNGDTQ